MPMYDFVCLKCDEKRMVHRPLKDFDLPEICTCGEPMFRDYVAEHCAVRANYKEPIVSESMAFDAIDVAAHRKRFPNIDLVIDGRCAKPVLRSRGQKMQYMKERGFVDTKSY